MRVNAHKENLVFEKFRKNNLAITSFIEPKNVIEDIEKIHNNKEKVYIFNSGDSAEFLYERSCVNDLSFNYLQMYNASVYLCFSEIVKMLKSAVEEKQLSPKSMFYITSEYEKDFMDNFIYDTGGSSNQSFAGYWFLKTMDNPTIIINGNTVSCPEGTIVLFGSGSQTQFNDVDCAISFNISTLSKLAGQYPQKWTPIPLS